MYINTLWITEKHTDRLLQRFYCPRDQLPVKMPINGHMVPTFMLNNRGSTSILAHNHIWNGSRTKRGSQHQKAS